jgi:hypothetical protein
MEWIFPGPVAAFDAQFDSTVILPPPLLPVKGGERTMRISVSGPHPLESIAGVPDAPTASLWPALGEECEETTRNNVTIPLTW